MSEKNLDFKVKDNIAYFTINREQQRNALNLETISLFLKYLDQAEADRTVRAILITGAGDRAFCTGADLGSAAQDKIQEGFRDYARLMKKLAGYPKPVVARINGACLAGGMGIMLACDIVIARNDVKFGTPEVNVGLFPMMIGALIYRNVLRKKAMEMILLGHTLDAEQARDMGLITRAVSPQKLEAEVAQTLKLLAAKSPIGMKLGKRWPLPKTPKRALRHFLKNGSRSSRADRTHLKNSMVYFSASLNNTVSMVSGVRCRVSAN
jgi:enoyl-CoA hydratase/carnithine racemase